jgi:hypothetical protein
MDKVYTPRDFVCTGVRWNAVENKLNIGVAPINDNGTLAAEMFFTTKKGYPTVVGGTYTGSEFCEDGVRALAQARYVRMWSDSGDRLLWDAKDREAEAKARSERMAKEDGRISAIEELLLPLRQQYASAAKRYDHATREALERAVLSALRTAPRKTEETK